VSRSRSWANAFETLERWNEQHPTGTRVRYWKGAKRGAPSGEAVTRGKATLMCNVPVAWLEGVSGCIALSHVEVVS
jgi:hypothetical protein